MIKEFHFERKKKQEAEGYDSRGNSNSNLHTTDILAFSNVGKVRKANEDDWGVAKTPSGNLFVVCDGMGGHVGGQKASSLAVESIIEYFKKEKYPNPIQALNDALQFANMQILGFANKTPEFKGMGTTACILLLQGDEAYIAHVGDSRIYLYLGKEKQLHRITKDHSFVQTLVDAGEITDEEAEHHPNKNRILKALGIKPELQPTCSEKPILPKNGDIFLICTDGLNGMISDNIIETILTLNTTIEQKGYSLINHALEAGGVDNVTVELIHIDSSKHKKSEFICCNPNSKSKPRVSIKKILIAVVIALSCIVGISVVYHFVRKNSQEKQIQELREKRDEAKDEVRQWETKVNEVEERYETTVARTEIAKNAFEIDTQSQELKNAYHAQIGIDNKAKAELDSLKKELNEAEQRARILQDSFKQDSSNIVNPPKNK